MNISIINHTNGKLSDEDAHNALRAIRDKRFGTKKPAALKRTGTK
jgi:hypothetical protein